MARRRPHTPKGSGPVPPLAPELEAEFQARVVEWATKNRWRHHHQYDARRSKEGWPDLALWRPETGEFLLAELKTEKGRVRPDQKRVIEELRQAGLEVHLWRPSDWEFVVERLRLRWSASGQPLSSREESGDRPGTGPSVVRGHAPAT